MGQRISTGPPAPPALAIVIPCYNYEAFVIRAIQSVLLQDRQDVEVVVVDDGSTDGSWSAILSTGVPAFRIPNSGARNACLYGLDHTTAPFVLFLDADDALKPGSLAKIIPMLDARVAKLQFALTRIGPDDEVISTAVPALDDYRDSEELARNVLAEGAYRSPPTSGNVFRRDLCEMLREADYDKFVDGAIVFAAPFLGDVVSISEELGCYRVHGSNDSGLGRTPEAAVLERDISRFRRRTEHLGRILARLGRGHEMTPPDQMYFHLERSLYRDIAVGRRPPAATCMRLVRRVWQQRDLRLKNKVGLSAFFTLAAMLPGSRSKAMLAYRLQTGRRSAFGLLSAIVSDQPR
ncbi:glycosyltransferase [Sinirhodobacter populi]|uniref:Glycosyltransferase n=1 Tax=Paenirhodobacter populi TaxID=2306993 RepID=A0A443KQ53_9RHOB|nr:glycosyltransferase [Sinirhodobacter populi]RWR35047.1 glycosyltransferase [Sinirhodobacter populi]